MALLWASRPADAGAFCGFYVGRADATLFNDASKVIMVRNGNRTVISMMNDYGGPMLDFALVIPVPVVLQKDQIHIGDRAVFDHIDAYSAPRLVEYFDGDPCRRYEEVSALKSMGYLGRSAPAAAREGRDRSLGVHVEATYTVGEYDIVILSAKQSDGLETWLIENDYMIPKGASAALQPYIRQGLKFFVAKVNLEEQAKTGVTYLRPIQFAFESPKFMLPIRLGMINARGPQELILYVLTREGRVETTNYRTIQLPSDLNIPVYVKDEFPAFYKAMFAREAEREGLRAVFTEYVWNMGWCDPCAEDPLSRDELRSLGVFWLDDDGKSAGSSGIRIPPAGGPEQVLITRLHVRYTKATFPEDLVLQETRDQQNYQARYVLQHPWTGKPGDCPGAREYFRGLRDRREAEAQTLARLTGWDIAEIRRKMGELAYVDEPDDTTWWRSIWN